MKVARKPFSIGQASRRWWFMLLMLVTASVYTYRARARTVPGAARFGGPAQGTTYSIVLGRARPEPAVMALKAAVDSLLANVDATMSTYRPTSELMRVNRDSSTGPVVLSEPLADVLRISQEVSRASGGAFDVTVAPLVNAWGFGPGGASGKVPDSATLAAILPRVGWQKLHLEGRTLTRLHPHIEIDLNAVAQGYTVDRISDLLVARGEPDHFVEVGGEVRARGRNIEGRPFRVGIEEPIADVQRVRLVIGLDNRALATSGNYRDFQDINGVRYTHILDPSTGAPVRHTLLSVSVLHAQCALADAWATALFVVGPERAWELAKANGLDVLLLTAAPNGDIQERVTDGFAATVLHDEALRPEDRTTRPKRIPDTKVP